MNAINVYPGINHRGINDQSARQPERQRELISQHTPLFMILSEQGPESLQVINSNQFVGLYGQESLTANSRYYTHQSEAVQTAIEAGNATIAIKRIVPDEAMTASVSLGIEELTGNHWFVSSIQAARTSSTYKPVMESKLNSPGEHGNKYRFVLSKTDSSTRHLLGVKDDVVFYRFQLLKINETGTGTTPIPNQFGEYDTLFCFRPDTIGRGGINYYLPDRIKECYVEREMGQLDDAVIGSFSFYIDNFTELAKTSSKFNPNLAVWNQDLDTLFGSNLTILGITEGLFEFTYSDGSDGLEKDMTDYITKRLARIQVYDSKCREFLLSLTDANPYTDDAKYPYSTLWDTGFSFDTKLAMRTIMDTRRDVWVGLSCFTVADNYLTMSGDEMFAYVPDQDEQALQGIASRLQAAYRLYPESYEFGTTAVRAIILKNSGVRNNSMYKKRRSIAIDTLWKVSKYMGAADGKFKQEWAIDGDNAKTRLLDGWSELNCHYQPPHIKTLSQQNGLTYAEPFDTSRYFIPYYQTIYDDPTSVLNDFITMVICCRLERLGLQAYRKYGTDGSLTPLKRAEKTRSFIEREAKDSFHGRVTIEAESIPPDSDSGDTVTRTVARLYTDKAPVENEYIIETRRRIG